jgi:hypothetical protein
MRKVLAVCGDSFMSAVSADEYGADSHFTQLLAKKLDWDYVTFARGGCGNSVIRLQIDEAIKIKPDLVIIGTTTADRLEFPIFPILRRTEENFWDGVYIKNHGLSNISWTPCDFSNNLELFNGRTPTLEAQTISNMINHPDYYVNGLMRCWYSSEYIKNLINILEQYYVYFFDMNWKKQQDTWIITSGLYKLKKHGINFFIIPQFMYHEDFVGFEDNMVKINDKLDPWNQISKTTRARFHTDLEAQERLADEWYNFLQGKI